MKTAEKIQHELNLGKNPNFEAILGYSDNGMRDSKVNGFIYEFDHQTGYCKCKVDKMKNLIININSIKLV